MAGLNPAQRAAVEHGEGPMLVLAGAGSGKTRVITERIARLVRAGVRPDRLLGVTFTNKAAAEMVERLAPMVGVDVAQQLWLSTFHSFGVRFLREESAALGYGSRYVIFDQGDATGLLREILRREVGADLKLDTSAILTRISLYKNAFLAPEDVPESDFEYDAIAREAYPHYQDALRSMHAVDFDDLVSEPVRVLRRDAAIRTRWSARFEHLLVDEFQDTNKSQLELVRLLTNDARNVCVVGDDDQSIYSWRGAEVGNILDFERYYPGAKIVKLEENYRSHRQILDVANAAIAQSRGKRHGKTLRAVRGDGEPVCLARVPDAEAQAKLVVREIRRLLKDGARRGDMAVLYRSNLTARVLEEELRVGDIPYRVYGGSQVFDKKEVKDAIAYLRAVVNPRDELSLRRIVNYPARGVGSTSIKRIGEFARERRIPFGEAITRASEIEGVAQSALRGLHQLGEALADARRQLEGGAGPSDVATRLFQSAGLVAELGAEAGPVGQRRLANLDFLGRSLKRFEERQRSTSLATFLTQISIDSPTEEIEAGDRVTLSSLHSSKGLEFGTVFFLGLVEGQLPHSRSLDPKVTEALPTDVEEERRLFYVGVTRARDRLYLVVPAQRTTRGRVVPLVPSRFLEGMPQDAYVEYRHEGEEAMSHDEVAAMTEALLARLSGGS